MLKKILAALLAGAMVLSFAACGGREEVENGDKNKPSTETKEEYGYFVGTDGKALYDKVDLGANPNKVDEEALTIFINAINREMSRETGRVEKNDIETLYCAHGSMQTMSKYKLDYDMTSSNLVANYAVSPNSEVSNIVHHKLTCDQVPQKGTPTNPAITTKDQLKSTLNELEGKLLTDALKAEYIKSITVTQDKPGKGETKGNVYITLYFTPNVEEKVFGNSTTLGSYAPKGIVVYSAEMKLDGEGHVKNLVVSKDIQDETGAKFDLLESKYFFKNMAGRASGEAAA